MLFHELGHAFISLYDLPITGREEDAVDQFAAILLAMGDEKGSDFKERSGRFALMGAYFFHALTSHEPSKLTRDIFADEHALGQQRYYDVMCLVLGSDNEGYGPILIPGFIRASEEAEKMPKEQLSQDMVVKLLKQYDYQNLLPYERAVCCEGEWNRYKRSWEFLINKMVEDGKKSRYILDS